jgi:hypothetical protein|tara:strand:+ start:542 stop:1276 length:735 start_codon:yes stop_codon:yes gene_type:complete
MAFKRDLSLKGELSRQPISFETLICFHPLDDWTCLSDLPELSDIDCTGKNEKKEQLFNVLIAMIGIFILISIVQFWPNSGSNNSDSKDIANSLSSSDLYRRVSSSSFDSDVDFDIYVEKFYRDARFMGIFPIRPKTTIIRFSPLDQTEGLAHIPGLSFGVDNDEKIEIYINPSTWKTFNKPMRYVLMYHESAHDVLNLRDLDQTESNEEQLLMYPALGDFRSFTMHEFIKSYQTLFVEYALANL